MTDAILEAFLAEQYRAGMALAGESDLLDLVSGRGSPPRKYVAHYHCTGLLRMANGEIVEAGHFEVGLAFPSDYLTSMDPQLPFRVVTWLGPDNVWHPQIRPPGAMCVGAIRAGTELVDLLYQVFDIITYNKHMPREDDALNPEACRWARHNMSRFPVDHRALKRRRLDLDVREVAEVGRQ